MPKLTIDGISVEAPEGATLLHAAGQAGVEIPTLCYAPELRPRTSCMICVVTDTASGRMLPACSALAEDGMAIETTNEEIQAARREVLQLLLSEHMGDCEAPCRRSCAASLDIPLMLRHIAQCDMSGAGAIAQRDLVLPATLGWTCAAPCEKGCRRRAHDEAISIRGLHRRAAEHALGSETKPPPCAPSTGKSVAIIGSGPVGLAAAWVLQRYGHACRVIEKDAKPGGRFRRLPEEELPWHVLDAEIEVLRNMGVAFEMGREVSMPGELDEFRGQWDAVIATVGEPGIESEGLFFAKDASAAVRSVGNGKQVAEQAHAFLCSIDMDTKPFDSRFGRLEAEMLKRYVVNRTEESALERTGQLEKPDDEARRCFHCDCHKPVSCKLRRYATEYGAKQASYRGAERPPLEAVQRSARVVFESGKCIRCGLCVELTRHAGEKLGLTFVGRGFDTRVAVPLGGTLAEGLTVSAERCVETCPTGALAFPNAEERDSCA